MQEQIYNMIVSEDKITWKSLIRDLIKSEQLDPWDINISLLAKKYRESLKELKKTNFFVSGKMLLASAVLLKIKSHKLLTEDIFNFDTQLYAGEEELAEYQQEYGILDVGTGLFEKEIIEPRLTIKTPLPRKRKVTINDLMSALQKALEVNQRRVVRHQRQSQVNVKIPEKKIDITEFITGMYNKIKNFFTTKKEKLTFTKLVPGEKKEDKIYSILSLLHLENQDKIIMNQKEHFGEIGIEIRDKQD